MDRSKIMRAVKSRDTGPEMKVRRLVHGLGFRYRLHRKDLPGKPDLVFATRRCVIFVHGCFWHGHDCPRGNRMPQTNAEYWSAKISRNRERDISVIDALKQKEWSPLIIWECELKDLPRLEERICTFLNPTSELSLPKRHP
ncbi:very short patch repair endonuclease [Azospirillum sp. sgz302134]